MAKLVKLTSDEGINTNSNSFKVQSDDDIIIAPNSTVSLLNGHISSGILSNYNVGGDDLVAGENGTILGSLYLTDPPTDRKRDILIAEGDYGISPMTYEMTRAFNKSLVYASESRMVSNTSNTLQTPQEADFGLETKVSLDTNKKVVIKYASTSQKYTADLAFSTKNSGVNIDAQGNISYTSPSGYAQIPLEPTLAVSANKEVFTNTDPTASFSQFDSITLTNPTGQDIKTAVINAIDLAGSSTDNAIVLNAALADVANEIVYTDANYTSIGAFPYHLGDLITTDDGTGVVGTPAANVNHSKIANVELVAKHENYLINEVPCLKSFGNNPQYDFLQPPILNADGTYTLVIDSQFANAVGDHLVVGAVYYITNNANTIEAICEATAITENHGTNPTTVSMTVNAKPYNGKAIDIANMNFLNSLEVFDIEGGGIILTPLDDGQSVGLFDKDANLLMTFQIKSIAENGGVFRVEAEEGSMVRMSADGSTLLTGMDAMEQIISIILDPTFDNTEALLTAVDRVHSDAPLDLATITIADTNPVAIADDGGLFVFDAIISDAPYTFSDDAGDDYVIFPVKPSSVVALEIYKFRKELFESTIKGNGIRIYKSNATKHIKLTLMNSDAAANLATATRLWAGTDVVDTYRITLGYTTGRAGQLDLTKYTLMIKGTLVRPASQAYCVEDNRLSHSCGRMAFLVQTAQPCEFGAMPETVDFNGQNVGNNDIRVRIEPNAGGYNGYTLYRGGVAVALKRAIEAKDGDRVIIAWGVSPSTNDFEYDEGGAINSASNPPSVNLALANNTPSLGQIVEEDRGKILVSVIRTGRANNYMYLGCPIQDPNNGADQSRVAQTIPWTPRSNPYTAPQYWNNSADLHAYVCPNQGVVRILELSPSSTITFSNGVWREISGEQILQDTATHSTNPDNVDDPHRLKSFANVFNFQFTDLDLQKSLGFKASTNIMNGSSGSWSGDLPYISALLPENLCILLDTLPSVETYDLGKTHGRRRSIIGVVVNSQDRAGEIVIEPSNLYRIKLNNDKPINLRRFVVSLEDFYGKQVILQSARAVINLLFEESTA